MSPQNGLQFSSWSDGRARLHTISTPAADTTYTASYGPTSAPGTLVFSTSSYQRIENGGSATVTVTRTGGLGAGMTVQYATANGTASAGSDYAATNGTLTFAAGATSASFQVPIINDTRDETNETVIVSLSNPAGGAVLGTRRTAVLTIADNDTAGALNFSLGAYQRSEDAGNATIRVLRTGGAASGVTVRYSTTAGTATASSDYAPVIGTLTFGAGQTSASFTVPLINDGLNEANETINLSLADPTGGATLGTPKTTVLTILDDE